MAEKKKPDGGATPPKSEGGRYSHLAKSILNWVDAPADLTLAGFLGYGIIHSLADFSKGKNISIKGVSDEAGFLHLCNTIKHMGGSHGVKVSKSLELIHATLYEISASAAEFFRGILLINLKEEESIGFFKTLTDGTPKTKGKSNKDAILKAYLLSHTEPRIMLCIELHNKIEAIQNKAPYPIPELAAEMLVRDLFENGEIPKPFMLENRERVEKFMQHANKTADKSVTAWTQSINKRTVVQKDPIDMVFEKILSLIGVRTWKIPRFAQIIVIAVLIGITISIIQTFKH